MQQNRRERKYGEWIEKCIVNLLKALLGIFRIHISDSFFQNIVQFIKFGLVGVSNTLISYCVYAGTVWTFHRRNIFPKEGYLLAQVGAFFLSATWSYCMNNYFTFQDRCKKTIREWILGLFKTFASYSFTGLGCSTLILIVLVKRLQLSPYLAQVINLILGMLLNFILVKSWVFHKTSK